MEKTTSKPLLEDTPKTRQALVQEATDRLKASSVKNARQEAEWLIADVLGCSRALLYAHPDDVVSADRVRVLSERLMRRVGGEPLSYVLGHADFYGLRLKITSDVLVPRPETEELVEEALRRMSSVDRPSVLDVGTGSGCIALAIKKERPGAVMHACDVSGEALAVARENAREHELVVRFFLADVLKERAFREETGASSLTGLDLLVSNPPYIPDAEAEGLPASVRGYEPSAALFCGDDPLCFYRALAVQAGRLLRPGGWVALETHAGYAHDIQALLTSSESLSSVHLNDDLAGRPRIVTAQRGGA